MTRKKTRNNNTGGMAFCLLLVTAIGGSCTIHGFEITSLSGRPTNLVATNANDKTRISSTMVYSKSKDVGEFKDIDIDDVLLEAENALNAAQSSLGDDSGGSPKEVDLKAEFKDINIDDVLLEAENALSLAQTSLGDDDVVVVVDSATKTKDDDAGTLKDKLRASVLSDDADGKASVEVTEILSSTLGGILLGSLLGSVAAFQLSDLGLLSISPESFSADILQFAAPTIAGVVLGGVTGFAGSLQDNALGVIVRNVLGVPAKALASAIVGSIQEAVRRQVEKTTNEIKSIPSNVANSAKETAVQKAKEAKLSVDVAIESLFEKLKQLVLVAVVLSSLVAVGIYATNGEIPPNLLPLQISNLEMPLLKF